MDLIPGNKYFLKWSSMRGAKPKINNLLILECEFLKLRDDTLYNDYNHYFELMEEHFYQEPDQVPEINELERKFTSKILNEQVDENTELSFDHPFYPYIPYRKSRTLLTSDKVGLFKLLNVFKTVNNGIPNKSFTNHNLDNFSEFSHNVAISTWTFDIKPSYLIPGKTLIWIDLNNVKIIEPDVAQRILEYKTLTSLENRLPEDITHEIAQHVGSQMYLHP